MPYDEDLADRIRELLALEDGVTEKKMFGGLAFLIGGRLAIGASGQGGIMVRVEPTETDRLLATTSAVPMVMRGRDLDGWVRVGADDIRTKRQLSVWARRGVTSARSLPPKPPSARRT